MQFQHCGSTESAWASKKFSKTFRSRHGSAALKVGRDVVVVIRSIVSKSAGRVTRSSALPRAHSCISGSSSRVLHCSRGKILEIHMQFFEPCAQICHLSTRYWLMGQLSAVHAKSMAFGATTQDLHSEPFCETSTVETAATRPDIVAQNAFTNHAVQRKAMQGVPERKSFGTLRWSSALTPRKYTVPCPNHGHTRWPEAIRPQPDRTGQ